MPGGQIMQGSYFILFYVFLKIYDPPHLETGRLGEGLSEASGAETGSALSAPFHFGSEASSRTQDSSDLAYGTLQREPGGSFSL